MRDPRDMRSPDPAFDIKAQERDYIEGIDKSIATLRAAHDRVHRLVGLESDPRWNDFRQTIQDSIESDGRSMLHVKTDREAAVLQGRLQALTWTAEILENSARQRDRLAQQIAQLEDQKARTVTASGRVLPQPL